jgi:hypothetical protein
MKSIREIGLVLVALLSVSFFACSGGGSGGKGSEGVTGSPGEKVFKPDVNLSAKENSDDSEARFENYARLIGRTREEVSATFKEIATPFNVTGLNDIDLTSAEMLQKLVIQFIGKTDQSLRFLGGKILGNDQMLVRFQLKYNGMLAASFSSQDEFKEKFGAFKGEAVEDIRFATTIMARLLANDLNALFPERFTVNYGSSQCSSTPCNDFVQRSLKLIDDSSNTAFFSNAGTNNRSARDVMAEFFAAVFNNLTFSVADKQYTFFNFKTGESKLAALPPDFAFEPKGAVLVQGNFNQQATVVQATPVQQVGTQFQQNYQANIFEAAPEYKANNVGATYQMAPQTQYRAVTDLKATTTYNSDSNSGTQTSNKIITPVLGKRVNTDLFKTDGGEEDDGDKD